MTNYFQGVRDLEAARKLYRDLARKFHPDMPGGDTVTMQAINAEYEAVCRRLAGKQRSEQPDFDWTWEGESLVVQAILAALKLRGVQVELIGSWVWCSGETRPHTAYLRAHGFKWSGGRKQWYWTMSVRKKRRGYRNPASMDDLRRRYGSRVFHR